MINDIEEFTVAGRSKKCFSLTLSIVASCIGGSATIGVVALGWNVGFPSFWYLGTGAIGLLFMGLFVSKRVRKTNSQTLPEFVGIKAGNNSRIVTSIIIVIAWLAILAAQFSAIANLIVPFVPLTLSQCRTVGALIIIIYTAIGGQSMVINSDRWQLVLIFIALSATLISLLSSNPMALQNMNVEFINKDFPISRLSYYLFIIGGSYLICPMLFGRLLSAKNEKIAKKATLIAVPILTIFSIIIVFIALASKNILPSDTVADSVLTLSIRTQLNPFVSFLLIIGLLAAIVSSADSCLITASTIVSNDLLKNKKVSVLRGFTLILGLLALLLCSLDKSILSYLFIANDIYVSAVVFPVFILLIAYEKYEINHRIFFLSILIGGICGFISAFNDGVIFSYIGIISSLIISIFSIVKREKVSL